MRNPPDGSCAEIGIRRKLADMGVDVYEPQTSSEESLAQTFGDFAHFVLCEEQDTCLEILESDLHRGGGSVGELQGGSDE